MGLQDENRESFDQALAKANEAERKKKEANQSPAAPVELSAIDEMDVENLRRTLKIVVQAGWGYGKLKGAELVKHAYMSKDEAYEALKLAALTLATNATEWREFVALATFWAEREKGKPSGAIPQINIGSSGNMKIEVVLVSPGHKLTQKVIDG
jgi:hypothetical protein